MNHSYPIFTADAECQDCFKCVRQCPVKAIRVVGGHASVMPDLCIACGGCVQVCPVHAKKIRDDLGRVRCLLRDNKDPVYASLAPSWINEFKGLPSGKMIAALRRLGFAGVSETALGAQIVSSNTAGLLGAMPAAGVMISSACPVAVDFIRKYIPALSNLISPVLSPALSHAKYLKSVYGENVKVVFIGPCIAKKNEADRHSELISMAMLFPRLKQWFKDENINPWNLVVSESDCFLPSQAKEGALYPVEGGMNETICKYDLPDDVKFVSVSGIDALRQMFNGFDPSQVHEKVFVETLACTGGCVHGPATEHNSPGLVERLRVLRSAEVPESPTAMSSVKVNEVYESAPVPQKVFSFNDIRNALSSIGKNTIEEELNCGGCGYNTCNNFAHALLEGKAEPNMCVSYLRELAQKKSNAIIRCIPAGVVVVDRNLNVIECNRKFAELSGADAVAIYSVVAGMAGAALSELVPYSKLFERVLSSGAEYSNDAMRVGGKLLSIRIFNIEPGEVVGSIVFDVTKSELRREQIAERAQEVIEKNLSTVQDIACKLGEHMAETEILLRSIAEKYSGNEYSAVNDEFDKIKEEVHQ